MMKNKLVVGLYFVEQFWNTLLDLIWTSMAQEVQNITMMDQINGLVTLNGTQCTIAQPLRISRSVVRVPFGVPENRYPIWDNGFSNMSVGESFGLRMHPVRM